MTGFKRFLLLAFLRPDALPFCSHRRRQADDRFDVRQVLLISIDGAPSDLTVTALSHTIPWAWPS
jgi:hypothetical protein